jgi:hypothetical protein
MNRRLPELDINPLMVLPSGQGVKAVDGLGVFCGTQHRMWLRVGPEAGWRTPVSSALGAS